MQMTPRRSAGTRTSSGSPEARDSVEDDRSVTGPVRGDDRQCAPRRRRQRSEASIERGPELCADRNGLFDRSTAAALRIVEERCDLEHREHISVSGPMNLLGDARRNVVAEERTCRGRADTDHRKLLDTREVDPVERVIGAGNEESNAIRVESARREQHDINRWPVDPRQIVDEYQHTTPACGYRNEIEECRGDRERLDLIPLESECSSQRSLVSARELSKTLEEWPDEIGESRERKLTDTGNAPRRKHRQVSCSGACVCQQCGLPNTRFTTQTERRPSTTSRCVKNFGDEYQLVVAARRA